MPKLRAIDEECADLLTQLLHVYENPPDPAKAKTLNVEQFRVLLADHPDFDIEFKLIEDGFPLGLNDRDPSNLCKNVRNYVKDTRELRALLKRMVKEAQKCYITPTLSKGKYVLTLLCVPKTDSETGLKTDIRVARHGSYSTKRTIAINDKILKVNSGIETLPNIKIYIKILLASKFVCIRDLKDAFRQLGLATIDCEWIVYCVFNLRFFDKRQAYGVASSAANCQHFTEILIWIFEKHFLSKEQIKRVLVHIDDFIIGAQTKDEAIKMGEQFDEMCRKLGVEISHAKSKNGIQEGVVHGFGFDLVSKMVYIPDMKFAEIVHALLLCLKYRWADGRALESICGKLMHWSQFRKHAKVLCFRILTMIHKLIRKNRHLRNQIFYIHDCICLDFRFWLRYAFFMREVSMESIVYTPSITITASTDASNKGGGFVVGSHYGSYEFRDTKNKYGINHRKMHINLQEAHAVVMLLFNFREELSGQKLLLYIDNKSVMYSMFRNWSGSLALMEYIHEIVLLMCTYKIDVHVDYITSEMNGLSDAQSRFEYKRFNKMVKDWDLTLDKRHTNLKYYAELDLLKNTSVTKTQMTETMERLFQIV